MKEKKSNDFDRQIDEIKEWQRNAYNPGHYAGSGKVPLPLKNSLRNAAVMLVIGVILLLPSLYFLLIKFSFHLLLSNIFPLFIGTILCAGGISRLFKNKSH